MFIIAPAASGKGVMTFAKALGMSHHQHLLKQNKQDQLIHKRALKTYEKLSDKKVVTSKNFKQQISDAKKQKRLDK